MRNFIRISFLIFAICGAAIRASADRNPGPIKIGATLALTGTLAFIGESERDGLVLAADEVNRSGGVVGRRIELVIEDNLGESKAAVSTVHKLLQINKPLIIFSAFTHITQPIKDVMARSDALLFYASTVKSIAQSSPYIFRDYYDIEAAGRGLAAAVAQAGHSKVALLREGGEACEEIEQSFQAEAPSHRIEVLKKYEFTSGDPDLTALLLKATTPRPEALVLCAWRDSQAVMKQLLQLGRLDVPTFHTAAPFLPAADTLEMRKLYEDNGAVSTWYGFVEGTNSKKQKEFIKKFKARFKRQPRPDAAYAYDDVFALKLALEPCIKRQTVNRSCLASQLKQVRYEGVAGELSFDSDGSSTRRSLLISVDSGIWKEVE